MQPANHFITGSSTEILKELNKILDLASLDLIKAIGGLVSQYKKGWIELTILPNEDKLFVNLVMRVRN